MKRVFFLLAAFSIFSACSTSYDEQKMQALLDSKGVYYWVQNYENISNVVRSKEKKAIIITNDKLNGSVVRKLKAYMKDKYEVESVEYYHNPDYNN